MTLSLRAERRVEVSTRRVKVFVGFIPFVMLAGCPTAAPEPEPVNRLERLRCTVATFIEQCPSSAFAIDIQEPLLAVESANNFLSDFEEAFIDPALVVDDAAFDACIDSLAGCADPFGRSACQLERILSGPHGNGEACSFLSCGPGLGCVDGTCRPHSAEGDACEFLCSGPDHTCVDGRCGLLSEVLAVGDPCDDLCGPGLACIDGVCVAQINADIGEPCDDYVSDVNALRYCVNQQAGATYCLRGQQEAEGVCASTPLPGEPCASTFLDRGVLGSGICRGNRQCVDDVCVDGTRDTGEACTLNVDCPLTDRCDVASAICTRRAPAGAACTATLECAEGTVCSDGVCAAPEPLCADP